MIDDYQPGQDVDDAEECAWDPINTACHYARHGLHVIPLIGKAPRGIKGWPDLASTNISDVVQMFEDAIRKAGSAEAVMVGWALGVDGFTALDLDHEDMVGADLAAVLDGGGYGENRSAKGRHCIWRTPDGTLVSNSTAGFPERGWGEVRGYHGQIAIAGVDRPGFDVAERAKATVFPRPEWLGDFLDAEQATPAEVEAFCVEHVGDLAPRKLASIVARTVDPRWRASRHVRVMAALGWSMRDARIDLFPAASAVEQLRRVFLESVAGDDDRGRKWSEPPEREFVRMVAAAVGFANSLTDEDLRLRRWDAVLHGTIDPPLGPGLGFETGAGCCDATPVTVLPERFWDRPRHAEIRDAALAHGVSPEALVLATLPLVAAHIPHDATFPGKRLGVPNIIGAAVGRPGSGKGSTLDRALELLPPPPGWRQFTPGTAQGLVRQFYDPTLKQQLTANPNLPPLQRCHHPVILRVDEIAKFTQATRGDHGQNLIAEFKSAVFGESLGQSTAAADKSLQCAPRSYRLGGLLGVAPGVAGSLFDDIDGGLPQRILFAPTLRADQTPDDDDLDRFDDLSVADDADDDISCYLPLSPLGWRPPPLSATPPAFVDSRRVAGRVAALERHRWDLLDAHVPYLTHAVAAVLAYLDERWVIQPADLTLAGDVVEVSRATRAALLDELDRVAATGEKRKRDARKREAVETAEAVAASTEARERLAHARRIVASVREWIAENGAPPSVRDLSKSVRDRGAWLLACDEAIARGWLVEDVQPTSAGGLPKRAVVLTDTAP